MIQTLVSVPPQLNAFLHAGRRRIAEPVIGHTEAFVGSDPVGTKLGSGGGTVSLLHSAWRQDPVGGSRPFPEWIVERQRLVLHAGGESRRLPGYAALGKALLPVPVVAEDVAARFDQALADFQLPAYQQVLREAGRRSVLMVASGDVWLEIDPLAMPCVAADIVGIGMRVSPEIAQHFGVFFVAKTSPTRQSVGPREQPIAFFRQKPTPAEIYRHTAKYDFYVDTGLWLFSASAVQFMFRRCGWSETKQRFATKNGHPDYLDLYSEIGSALGSETQPSAVLRRHGWSRLSSSVVPLDDARFFHLGSSRQIFESFEQLSRNTVARQTTFSFATPGQAIARQSTTLPVWLDAASDGEPWQLDGLNIVTGSASGARSLRLRQEQCVEIAPVGRDLFVLRPYLLDDTLRGTVGKGGTICGQDAAEWLRRRGYPVLGGDVFNVPIYPLLRGREIDQSLLDWFFASEPGANISTRLSGKRRLSAGAISGAVDFRRYFARRLAGHTAMLIEQFETCLETGDERVFQQDFAAVVSLASRAPALRDWLLKNGEKLLARLIRPEQRSRLLMLVAELGAETRKEKLRARAHAALQQGMISSDRMAKAQPRLALKDDQIVWARSPVRLDLAGGWTDTPPYCFERGGAVVNVAVLLNGQPPIQVFVRPLPEPIISLRSIDLGSTEQITTYAALATFRDPRSGFSLPKAALCMAGFHPDFSNGRPAATLRSRLERFGGGLEISLLSAVPKGSGLGTSSILAATILGALNRACGLGWDEVSLYDRVLGVEQLLTTGGGWQDQAGALFRGIKLVETSPGLAQTPSVRYLPSHLFGPGQANHTLLLYYTGITRLAKGILKEIVHDMFLRRFETLETLDLVRRNALALFSAVQRSDPAELNRCIARAWDLNKRLDRGTTTPEIDQIIARCGPDLAACKLLGAGGGGYMLLCAATPDAGLRIRSRLEQRPPNTRARFIDFKIAETGLEISVS